MTESSRETEAQSMVKSTKAKTAIMLIHGMGEPRPMETLWSFVDAVWSTDADLVDAYNGAVYAKPDTISDSFDLRRVTTRYWKSRTGEDKRRIDFFEFYWAHLMTGNTLRHTLSWIVGLFIRRPSSVPPALFHLWVVGTVLLVAGMVLFGLNGFAPQLIERFVGRDTALWLSAALTAAGAVAGAWLAPVAGDAARYFSPTPDNVEARQAIMRKGVDVLERLTRSGEYDRIVLVGHSLGSAIGLDILHHSFGRIPPERLARSHRDAAVSGELSALEKTAGRLSEGKAKQSDYAEAQHRYFKALAEGWQTRDAAWLVSDFVTLGCPLSKADVLLAKEPTMFDELKERRQVPTCPPRLEQKEPPRFSYALHGDARIPHFGAVFGPTAWTNIHFPSRLVVMGDVISGPVAPLFGKGVLDVEVPIGGMRFRHNDYWANPNGKPVPTWITELRLALAIRRSPPAGTEEN